MPIATPDFHPQDVARLARLDLSEVLRELSTSTSGLSTAQARTVLGRDGPNQIDATAEKWPIVRFLEMFISPLSIMLMGLSAISYITGEKRGAIVIVLMVFLSTVLTFTQEYKSNRVAKKLRDLVAIKATVVRNGIAEEIDVRQIVAGDVIALSAGDIVPGDLRVIESKDLFVNQASLTGESLPVEKSHLLPQQGSDSMLDWSNVCCMGSHVVSGTAKAIVLQTGSRTLLGRLAKDVTGQSKASGFDRGVKRYIWMMIRFMLVMVPTVFLINGLLKGDWIEAALFAIAVSVGLAPEMLPMLVTINLAKGAMAMSRKHVIVKRLSAIQSLGAMNVLCVDKTGTLTQDEIILERHVDVTGQEDERVLEYAYLNSHYQQGLRNLLDIAVLKKVEVHKRLHDFDTYQKIDEIPFDFQRRRMSVIVQRNREQQILICKGAVEEIFSCCSHAQIGSERVPLDKSHREKLDQVVDNLNQDGFRVIAVATRIEPIHPKTYSVTDEADLTLLGYIAFLDPPKESARPAIKELLASGVQIKVLTGDNERITRKVCGDVALEVGQVLRGAEIETMSDDSLIEAVRTTNVFVKMTPHQKSRVILALQSCGDTVGYMGDGINDGPALKLADVSISVDTAVDIAKESADLILLEKSLLVLHKGVIEGRRVFANLMKYLRMVSSSNLGNVISMLASSAFLPFLPITPAQVLLNNLLYDVSQTAVSTDNVDREYLMQPQTWEMTGIAHYMFVIGPISSFFDFLTFAILWFVVQANTMEQASLFQTGWFVESLLSQTLIVHVIRTRKVPFFQSQPSRLLLATTLGVCLVGIALPYTEIGQNFQMQPLPAAYWAALTMVLPGYLLLTQWVKSRITNAVAEPSRSDKLPGRL